MNPDQRLHLHKQRPLSNSVVFHSPLTPHKTLETQLLKYGSVVPSSSSSSSHRTVSFQSG